MSAQDTIVAIATAPGVGGVGIVRVSGPAVPDLIRQALEKTPEPRHALYTSLLDEQGEALDQGIALYFPAPHSFTGEEVFEFQGHGGPVVLDLIVKRFLKLGARMARPGEFSERAFINGKLDLAQAEAVADLIESGSEAAARGALLSLQGAFSRRVHELVEKLVALRTYVEASIDFPEEEIDFLADKKLIEQLNELQLHVEQLQAETQQGCLLHDGIRIVLAGPPNVGKSSLLNALAGQDSAIVSDTPGTTRDIVREQIHIDGMPVHVLDTAGLRQSQDEIETEGMRRAFAAMQQADQVLLVVDDNDADIELICDLVRQLPAKTPYTVVRNKIDVSAHSPQVLNTSCYQEVLLSAKTGLGIDLLREHLKSVMAYKPAGEGSFTARRRHLDAIENARQAIARGRDQLQNQKAGELLAEELRLAQQALNSITGEFTSDDLLGEIFAGFCIGK